MTDYLGYKSIKDAIVGILENIEELKTVYGKNEKALKDFPCACVYAANDSEVFDSVSSSGTNEIVVSHRIDLHFRVDEGNDPDYEDVLEAVADKVKQTLRSHVDLDGACEYAIPAEGEWIYGEKETPTRVYRITMRSTLHIRRDNGLLV